jgi:hypothetical protein
MNREGSASRRPNEGEERKSNLRGLGMIVRRVNVKRMSGRGEVGEVPAGR